MAIRLPDNECVLVAGYRGSGKSYLAADLAKRWVKDGNRRAVLLWCPKDDPDGPWNAWGCEVFGASEIAEAWDMGHRCIRLRSRDPAAVTGLCHLAAATRHSTLVIDEAGLLKKDEHAQALEIVEHIAWQGRAHGQGLIACAQYYSQIPPAIREQCTAIVADVAEGGGRQWAAERGRIKLREPLPRYHWIVSRPGEPARVLRPLSAAERRPVQVVTLADGSGRLEVWRGS